MANQSTFPSSLGCCCIVAVASKTRDSLEEAPSGHHRDVRHFQTAGVRCTTDLRWSCRTQR